jgi:hypothetical protein
MGLKMIFAICALVCFLLKAFLVTARVDFMNLGFAFTILAVLIV